MSNALNQQNKEAVWDFWQKLNHVGIANLPDAVRAAVHEDVIWNVFGAYRSNHRRRVGHR